VQRAWQRCSIPFNANSCACTQQTRHQFNTTILLWCRLLPQHQPLNLGCPISSRELIHYRGEPDPFKGDVPNARVREFAKEVVDVMFNASPAPTNTGTLTAQVGCHAVGKERTKVLGAEQAVGSQAATACDRQHIARLGDGLALLHSRTNCCSLCFAVLAVL
jgi:hypothetical protein